MATGTIFITASDARQNPIRERIIHDEARAIESVILDAVKNGYFNATISDNTPMTQSTPLGGFVSAVDANTGTFTIFNHPFYQGDVVQVNSTSATPSPILSTSFYYVIYIDNNNIKLASSFQNAMSNRPTSIALTNGLSSIILDDHGSGYINAPVITISGGNASSSASAIAYLASYGSVSDIGVITSGGGFTDVPLVQITSQGTGAVAGAISFKVVNFTVSAQGANYRLGDSLLIGGGIGTPAIATVTQVSNGAVLSVSVNNAGNYSVLPALANVPTTVSPSGGSGCTLNLSMGINSIAVASGGSQYIANPLVLISGGSGTGATATCSVVAGAVVSISVTNPGQDFTSTPNITFNNGNSAQAIAILQPTSIGNIVLTNNGGNIYTTSPSISINSSGSGATAGQVYMRVSTATLSYNGTGYSNGDILLVSGGLGSTGATIQVVAVGTLGEIVTYNLLTGGSYSQIPLLSNNTVLGGTGKSATFNLTLGIDSVSVGNPGSNYTTPPAVTINSLTGSNAYITSTLSNTMVSSLNVVMNGENFAEIPSIDISSGSGATAIAHLTSTGVGNITITNSGTNYSSATVTINGDGVNATAIANINNGSISNIVIENPGTNYTYISNIIISGDGINAAATGTITPTSVNYISLLNNGSNYTSNPNIVINGGATAISYLTPAGVDRIDVTQGGENYTSPPIVAVIPNGNQQGNATSPSTSASIGFSVDHVIITDPGANYQTTPTIAFSAPQDLNGNIATATATIGVGQGTISINKYLQSYDYFSAWQGTTMSDPNLSRPYNDRMDTIITYFTSMGYNILRQTNPATNNTLIWQVTW